MCSALLCSCVWLRSLVHFKYGDWCCFLREGVPQGFTKHDGLSFKRFDSTFFIFIVAVKGVNTESLKTRPTEYLEYGRLGILHFHRFTVRVVRYRLDTSHHHDSRSYFVSDDGVWILLFGFLNQANLVLSPNEYFLVNVVGWMVVNKCHDLYHLFVMCTYLIGIALEFLEWILHEEAREWGIFLFEGTREQKIRICSCSLVGVISEYVLHQYTKICSSLLPSLFAFEK